jgi:hypothetical protein
VNNDPVNWVDLWGLSASDQGRSLTVEEKNLYTQAAGHSINYDNIRIYESKLPTVEETRRLAESVGFDTTPYSYQEVYNYINHSDMQAISLPGGSIYIRDGVPSTFLLNHELHHQDTYQNGATITVNGLTMQLNTTTEVLNQLIYEGELYDHHITNPNQAVNPYLTPGYLEYQANQMGQRAVNINSGRNP